MNGVLTLSLAIARSGWQASWNRMFRFSRMKAGLIWLALQGLAAYLVARRAPAMAPDAAEAGLVGAVALIAAQMGWFGIMGGFSRGQAQLYQGLLVPLFQLTPARPLAFLLGRVIESLPTRLWTTLLWAWAYSSIVPPPGRWPALALLWLVGAAAGVVAHLAGLLLLTFWGRFHPRTMRHGNTIFGVLTMALITAAIIYLSSGGTATELALVMRESRRAVLTTLTAVAGVPGLLLAATLLVRPEWVEEHYRQGLYRVLELNEQDTDRPGRSFWLPLRGDGVLRAVLSREWLHLARSKMTRTQLLIFVAGAVGVWFAGRAAAGQPAARLVGSVGALSLLAWFNAFGHWVSRVFQQERVTIALYRLAAVPTPRLIAAKLIAVAVPSGLLVAVAVAVGSVAARLSLAGAVALLLRTELALLFGVMGGFGAAAAFASQDPEEPEAPGAPQAEQGGSALAQSSAWSALARTIGLTLSTALPLWAAAGTPWLPAPAPLAWALALGLPLALLVGGVWVMLRTWRW
ncbi:hypothetical protein J2Z79_000093 [Symbiobacterium terraclitae]|uniref:ABC-2 type transport system permease protein n=1 Tax=Symbiobacterium terraclitae TaxID=557451 RepID=A0ABS4JMG1_9FIRM|nr:hypothetical protein [Symbiobacterium terraclitae]MBP2016720.1 hypothetical protein [Symbiobacterium terraclitae]